MQNKWWVIFNIFVLTVISLLLILVIWKFSFEEAELSPIDCIEANKDASFVYNACYDAYSKNILLRVERGQDGYNVNALKVSFFDFTERSYKLDNVPDVKKSESYKISADRNPENVDVTLNIVGNLLSPICEEPKRFFVGYCPSTEEDGVDVSITPLGGTTLDNFVEIGAPSKDDSDVLALSLVEKERIWESKCKSRWTCDEWESCIDGVQRRECKDVKGCFVPTSIPSTVKYCDDTCVENWECEWSGCKAGFTVPKCKDLNSCGTLYSIPHKLECEADARCVPDIECGSWSECEVDYNFMDLVGGVIGDLGGARSRSCMDKNSCVGSKKEVESCSVNVDIYTKKFTKCGEDFVGIYDSLDDSLIARIKRGSQPNPYLNIHLDGQGDSEYCDYCFDGRMNGDEEGIDCGGSCESCADKYEEVSFRKQSWWGGFIGWIKGIFATASLLN